MKDCRTRDSRMIRPSEEVGGMVGPVALPSCLRLKSFLSGEIEVRPARSRAFLLFGRGEKKASEACLC